MNLGDYASVGDNPIGLAHTSYGRFTYVNDAHGDPVYKIDNASNTVVGDRSAPRRRYVSRAGQDGPSWRTSGFAKNVMPERRLRRACVISSAP
jgi:DNA-binding beta-propeller fold protein YncE